MRRRRWGQAILRYKEESVLGYRGRVRGGGNQKKKEKGEDEKKKKRNYRIATGGHTRQGQRGRRREDRVNCPIGGEGEGGEGHCPVTGQ